jgi:hypothetical protein
MKNITRHLRTDRDIAAAPGRKVSRDYCGATKKTENPSTYCCCFGCSCCTSLIRLLLLILAARSLSVCHERESEYAAGGNLSLSAAAARIARATPVCEQITSCEIINHEAMRCCPHSLQRNIVSRISARRQLAEIVGA